MNQAFKYFFWSYVCWRFSVKCDPCILSAVCLKGKTGNFNIVLVFSLLNNVYFRFLAVCAVWVHKWPLKIGLFCLFSFFCTTYFLKKSSKNYAICITLEIFLSKRVKRPLKDHFGTYFRSQEVPLTISRKHAEMWWPFGN